MTNLCGTVIRIPELLPFVQLTFGNVGIAPLWLPAIWHPFSIPKCAFFMWLVHKNRVLTKDRMIWFGFTVNPNFVLCQSNLETVEHTFTDCPYTYLVLRGSPVPITRTWHEWQTGIFTDGRLRKHLAWLYISAVIYSVWRERNNRIHHNGQTLGKSQNAWFVIRFLLLKLFGSKWGGIPP